MEKSEELKNVVVPGDRIGVAEEFLPGPGTYEVNYQIRSAVVGRVVRDLLNKVAYVRSLKPPRIPQSGAIVLAVITEIREDFARAKILAVNNVAIRYYFTGVIHVTQVIEKVGEAKQMFNYVRLGDLVRARTLNNTPPFLLSIKESKLGVVLASCSKCGATLKLHGEKLKCLQCGNIETRKIGHGYGSMT
ncbi:MAG: exosome complex RNA-binding protein Csl4 [Sulfolobales archaeon]|nr:exosome complex RNA-binding protein Csl4 [Sulfolobales archaeon]MDW8082507.1 exosome complex RNA-binding protein Csl4 [Sulfolobales archaeon]